jgi:hypothetical protein
MHRPRSARLAVLAFALALVAPAGTAVSAHEPTSSRPTTMPSARGPMTKGPMERARMDTAGTTSSGNAGVPRQASPFTSKAGSGKGGAPGQDVVVSPPVQATLTANPPINQPGFDGMARSSGPDTNGEPPDPFVAVGPDHVMQILNSSFKISDRAGTPIDASSVSDFIGGFSFDGIGSPQWFDPHVIYDSVHGRWLMTVNGVDCTPSDFATFGTGFLFFATSDTTDPSGFWTGTFFALDDFLLDYSAPGTSSDKFAVGTNYFNMDTGCFGGSFDGTDVIAVDWTDWLGTDSNFKVAEVVFTGPDTFTPRVATQVPATSGRLHIVAEYAPSAGATDVKYFSVTGSVAAETTVKDVDVDLTAAGIIAPFATPPQPSQEGPNTIAEAVDERPTDAIWQNNRLSFVSTYPCTPAGDSTTRDCVRISQLDTTGVSSVVKPSLRQDFLIAENGKDSFMGGVGMAGDGTLHAVWSRTSATAGDFPSSYASYQLPSDAVNTVSPKELLQAGTGVYTGERWGDYVGVAQDPLVPSAVWQANQYSGGGSEWKTWVSRLQPAGTTFIPVTPARILDTRNAIGLSGKFTANQARTWQVTGHGGVPAGAVAVTGNVTVTQQNAAGYLAVTPTPTNTPPSSSINFPVGDNRANNLTVALSATGSLSAVYKAATGKTTQLIFDVTGYFLANDTGTTYTTITPARVLDTRDGTGLSNKFLNNVPRTLTVTGAHGIPGTATAVTGNLTVTQQSGPGYIAVTQDPTATPATSTLNFPVSDNRANGVYAPLNGAGELSIVYKSGTPGAQTQVILDVTGYFEPGTGGLRFVPLNPSRIMDTRSTAVGSRLSGVFHANTARILGVEDHWGVPAGAAAVSGNLTVTSQTGAGYVAVSPDPPAPVPATSTLNFPLGDTRANGLVTPLNGTGDTYLVYVGASGKTTQLILDLSGYFE